MTGKNIEKATDYGYLIMLGLTPLDPSKKMPANKTNILKDIFKARAKNLCDAIVLHIVFETKEEKKATKDVILTTLCSCDWIIATKSPPDASATDKYCPDNLVFVVCCSEKDNLLIGAYDTNMGIALPVGKCGNPVIPNKKGRAIGLCIHPHRQP